ncbi:U6 snRNA-associated Sm-like protein LSm5 [Monocercomonoides exilis]|uniref:U6 snRNA-associated Sm-like protein LSm5 n=1 Tax=Monocercomonoides exilis TaxID=2049356 RepID=UPI003559FC63|nr:U6 snRNA-associated Sm-like protein LSm5 [Monocercomonoides exilis]|eukprot:MONOS_16324.1-p1 / transcript=MONOS_16324.1 / gene=MONOS_16324 / organism=Monocercomonoides_exilis_PA203 / gene_product=U6 snRNA-associated Sm-like protein LSm5 / transcript_product=U6 snRNA-associated Sm-like protein LSm5 / location=Mono_scaffold01648:2849-3377(-) / protein_length=99 / sequence_SO=supercontig / SO=protein_coding / is_pseudo=false
MSIPQTLEHFQKILPIDLVEKCIGSKIWILMRSDKEFVGTLKGFDDFLNVVLSDVDEFDPQPQGLYKRNHLKQLLLNGTNIAVLIPGGTGPSQEKLIS